MFLLQWHFHLFHCSICCLFCFYLLILFCYLLTLFFKLYIIYYIKNIYIIYNIFYLYFHLIIFIIYHWKNSFSFLNGLSHEINKQVNISGLVEESSERSFFESTMSLDKVILENYRSKGSVQLSRSLRDTLSFDGQASWRGDIIAIPRSSGRVPRKRKKAADAANKAWKTFSGGNNTVET